MVLEDQNNIVYMLGQGCQTESPGGRSVCRFLWFPFNQLSIKALRAKRLDSLAKD